MAYPLPRRTVSDLVARYKLEPTVRDVFVEGVWDARIVRGFLHTESYVLVTVTVADAVEIPDAVLSRYLLTRGEKNELIALASELSMLYGDIPAFTAVVDADCDRLLGVKQDAMNIHVTDFTCMEMYWMDGETIRRFYSWLGNESGNKQSLIAEIGAVAQEMFSIRSAVQSLELRIPIIPFRKYCSLESGVLALDADRYLTSLLTSGRCSSRKRSLKRRLQNLFQLCRTIYVTKRTVMTSSNWSTSSTGLR